MDLPFKVVLLGKERVGKTSLFNRFLKDRFDSGTTRRTTGTSYGDKAIEVDGRNIYVGLWDTAGVEKFHALSPFYFRGAQAAVVCYDVTSKPSFEEAMLCVKSMKAYEEACKIYLTGTKFDLVDSGRKKKVSLQSVTEYAQDIAAEVFETSSKTGYNVKELFLKIAKDFAEVSMEPRVEAFDANADTITLEEVPSKTSKTTCSC
ncbi:ras-related protein Rab-24-like [Acanthaster planci]|uniref:Ras-related protein Rab-24-like n=1 Tax=Acanthaster planci TaxID=133434 RepID=A0A8B7Y4V9_ACAPL|nr:ras-related protein Rab-24-like [Acanthaster planci]